MGVHGTEGDSMAPQPDRMCLGVPVCPLCGSPGLIRIHRRPIDRVLSLFVEVYRFRCQQFECQWEGNLTKRQCLRGTHGTGRVSHTH